MAASTLEHSTESKDAETASRTHGHGHRAPQAVIEPNGESAGQVFGGSLFPYAADAARLLAGVGFTNSANSSLRTIALKRSQQAQGNRDAQRIIRELQSNPTASPVVQRRRLSEGTSTLGVTVASPRAIACAREGYFTRGSYGSSLSGQLRTSEIALAKRLDGVVIGDPSDPLEHEADRVAEVATQPSLDLANRDSSVSAEPLPNQIRRACAACGNGECSCADRSHTHGPAVDVPALSELQSFGSGSPLSDTVRESVEPILGADLSRVRVHNEPASHDAAAYLQARAFTHGSDIWLGANQSQEDISLLAHEATHVVQQTTDQAAGKPNTIQRQGWAHVQHPNQPVYPKPPDPYPSGLQCDQRALAAMHTETVELKGTPDFNPSYWLAEGLSCAYPEPVWVRVRFGNLASGAIRVRMLPPPATISTPGTKVRGPYETTDPEAFIPLTHPAFPSSGVLATSPKLFINIHNSEVTGNVGFFTGFAKIAYSLLPSWQRVFTLERLLGWPGLTDVQPKSVVNELHHGVLRFALQDFTFGLQSSIALGGTVIHSDEGYQGTGNFAVLDEGHSFSADALIQARGIGESRMPLLHVANRIIGTRSFSLDLKPTDAFGGAFSGSLEGTYSDGVLTIQGTAQYRSRRVNGSMTVIVAPRAQAWEHVIRQLPGSANSPGISASAATARGHVVVGWGTINFALNDWLNGSVSVIVDPDGYITSHGILRPKREFMFLTDKERYSAAKQIGKPLTGSVTILPVAGFFDLGGHVDGKLFAEGRVGPGRVYDLEVEGTFSTRPGSVFQARASGRINVSAWGRLSAVISGGLHFSVAGDVVRLGSVDVEGKGAVTARVYVELQPIFERIDDPTQPDTANYRISATLTAAGAADLALSGSIIIRVVGKQVGSVNLGRYQWNLGSLGMSAGISHVLGSHAPIELALKSADFDDAKFSSLVENLINSSGDRSHEKGEAELTQEATTKPAARPATPTHLYRKFTMASASHTLRLDHTPEPVLKMESNGNGSLTEKLHNEITIVEQQVREHQGVEAELLTEEATTARNLLGQAHSVEQALGRLESESRQAGDVAGFEELAGDLSNYGAQYHKTDLAQTPSPPPLGGAGAPASPAPAPASAPNQCPEPLDLAPGVKIFFPDRRDEQNFGVVIAVRADPKFAGGWAIQYRPTYARAKTSITTPAYDAKCLRTYYIPGPCTIQFESRNTLTVPARIIGAQLIPARQKAEFVKAYPLCWSDYLPPVDVPVGQDRVEDRAKWPAAHLINGSWGGPGAFWNLIPVPREVNNGQMPAKYETRLTELIKQGLPDGKYYWFSVRVFYHGDADDPTIGHYSDFVQSVDVEYGELVMISPDVWEPRTAISNGSIGIKGRPQREELLLGRRSG
jgi:Domain of unknown function (DUF4157)